MNARYEGNGSTEALAVEIDKAWRMLVEMPARRRRTLYLTTSRRIVWASNDVRASHLMEIGTYDRNITLRELEGDVHFINEHYTRQHKKAA